MNECGQDGVVVGVLLCQLRAQMNGGERIFLFSKSDAIVFEKAGFLEGPCRRVFLVRCDSFLGYDVPSVPWLDAPDGYAKR
uniref:Uncharacterized protein n=1 Tax=Globodera rostochiensis TaxID=31243 RepID=A0A914H5G6_GLORO